MEYDLKIGNLSSVDIILWTYISVDICKWIYVYSVDCLNKEKLEHLMDDHHMPYFNWQNQTSPFFLLFIFTTSHFPRPAAVPNNFVNFTSPTSLLGGSHPIFRPSTTLLNFNRTFDCCLSTDQTLRRNVKYCRIFLNIEEKNVFRVQQK